MFSLRHTTFACVLTAFAETVPSFFSKTAFLLSKRCLSSLLGAVERVPFGSAAAAAAPAPAAPAAAAEKKFAARDWGCSHLGVHLFVGLLPVCVAVEQQDTRVGGEISRRSFSRRYKPLLKHPC